MRIYFDIETAALPEPILRPLMPEFSAPAHYKKPDKIAESIAEKQSDWLERAALCATTGRVRAIGWRRDGKSHLHASGDEAADLREWWYRVEQAAREGDILVGFNIARFDLPFLMRRSWALRVTVPLGVFNGPDLNHLVFQDLYEEWQCGDRSEMIGLHRLSDFLLSRAREIPGLRAIAREGLTGDEATLAELENHLILTEQVACRLLGKERPHRPVLPSGILSRRPRPLAIPVFADDY
ncbi:MAG TPA: hypothetical protein VG796_21225 [Verrucomicrobiales bacterium]|jgi:hypothetical protein|nr:hypothetical protein [Verrucomicrobiales bacterium]